MRVSPHFTLSELTVTQTGIQNVPQDWQVSNLSHLCAEILEPIRSLWGGPVLINSAFRSEQVEIAVSGKAYGQHMRGQAADIRPNDSLGISTLEAYELIYMEPDIRWDQLIYERKSGEPWIHVSWSATPRRMALIYTPKTGGKYLQFDRSLA